ncbi:DUF2860 domain-containing protein [Vibrio panuliri]|uniref:DUF2860 domain-containing protein n=1 Tax=Vibrio panuliri TaxID=1381081 RepID=A0A1Q9HKY8_9VIBR|nr:DUF2860 domain-containing protein [Vibrio panuliri]KAB1460710.1 DUF2860 domain-containing protein [Vibrio panuliri]OLQ91124.1 hypothetical protein BIY22_18595 [Vibrio panuliri]OLQ92164.1 hypothetical protein BIY20_08990 [Vibrio panuliri]
MDVKYSLLTLALISSASFAQLSENAGFSGEISLNAGFFSVESNLNTDDDNKNLKGLNQTNDSVSGGLILPLGNLAYTFGSDLNQQFYMGTSRDDIATGTLAFEMGYKYQLASGMIIDASFLPTIMSGEVWADPFQAQNRQTTDEEGNAYRLKVENLAGSKFSVDMAYGNRDVENERSGYEFTTDTAQRDKLSRDADTFFFRTDYKYMVDRTTMLKPRLSFISSDADGDANSFKGYGVELSYFKFLNRHQFALTAGFDTREYDAENPIFNATREDDELSLFAAYEYANVMDWQDWSFISFAGFGSTDSNIDFYDKNELIMSVGMNYQF